MMIQGKPKAKKIEMKQAKEIASAIADDFNLNYADDGLISYVDVLDMFGMLNLGFAVMDEETGEPTLVVSSHSISHAFMDHFHQLNKKAVKS